MMQNSFAAVGWLIGSLLLVGGLIGIIAGRRGRRVGEHPHCRKCGFDLFGKPETSNHCPECGVDVTPARATVIGQRRPRRGLRAVGVGLFLLSLLFLGTLGWQRAKQIEWIHHYPLGWIFDDAADPSSAGYAAAWNELGHRAALANLSDTDRQRIITFILDIHADRNKAWKPQYDDVLRRLHKDRQWTQENWDRFARNCLSIGLTTRPKLRVGGQPHASAHFSIDRNYGIDFDGQVVGRDIEMAGHPVRGRPLRIESTRRDRLVGGTTWLRLDLGADAASGSALGPQELSLVADVTVRPRGADGPVASFAIDTKCRFELIAHDASEVERASPPDMIAAMESAWVSTDAVRGGGKLHIRTRLRSPPVPLAMAVEVRRAGTERWTGVGVIHETLPTVDRWLGGSTEDEELFNAGAIDVRLVPSDDALQFGPYTTPFWGREMIRRNVTVREPNELDLLQDESLRPAVERSVWILRSYLIRGGTTLEVVVMCNGAPVSLNHRAVVTIDGKAVESPDIVRLGVMPVAAGFGGSGMGFHVKLPDPANPPKQIDIELRPVPNFGHANAADGPAWGGTLWFKDVPVPYQSTR